MCHMIFARKIKSEIKSTEINSATPTTYVVYWGKSRLNLKGDHYNFWEFRFVEK